ncbi:RBR-type E3 ubiquitin transferase [Aphelenchoides besseyi]|nr:RBR-type E3 ubiquitin transferase [Aphelenchoides besseyi]KAI6192629.1 RBR-type E3 ubiquitin transferase [Aphelenchoides besseyi]
MDLKREIACILLLFFIGCLTIFADDSELPVCSQYQACGARLRSYPLLEESVGNMIEEIGSGVSSGEEVEIPMQYDEFVTAKTPFDFNAEPTVNEKRLCRCPQEDENLDACNYDDSTNSINLDPKRITLSFCQSIRNITHGVRCLGRNHQFIVIGQIAEDGQTLSEVNEVAAYCHCPNGIYQQTLQVQPWSKGYLFSYKCGK